MNKREMARASAKLPAHFCNVDLDVFSPRPLDVLAQAMEKCGTYTLDCGRFHRGGYRASFEVNQWRLDADETIKELGRAIGRLPGPARRAFDHAKLRDFSIGIQAGKEPHAFELSVSTESLAVITALRGRLSVTVYSVKTAKQLAAPVATKAGKRKTR